MFAPLPNFALSYQHKILNLSTPKIMGIVNVTPDSFSDGGQFLDVDAAVLQASQLIQDGADIIDIGAESTRPNAAYVSPEAEIARLSLVVRQIRQQFADVWISIDTSSPVVMQAMADLGADMWNDVRALKQEGARQMAAQLALPVVIMHSRGTPSTMDKMAVYDDVLTEVAAELQQSVQLALDAGVRHENIVLDVGMGFAKNFDQHVQLVKNLQVLMQLGYPMLFGVSRKRFIGQMLHNTRLDWLQDNTPAMRDTASAALALCAVMQGASIIRTHNVKQTVETLAVWNALVDTVEDD